MGLAGVDGVGPLNVLGEGSGSCLNSGTTNGRRSVELFCCEVSFGPSCNRQSAINKPNDPPNAPPNAANRIRDPLCSSVSRIDSCIFCIPLNWLDLKLEAINQKALCLEETRLRSAKPCQCGEHLVDALLHVVFPGALSSPVLMEQFHRRISRSLLA